MLGSYGFFLHLSWVCENELWHDFYNEIFFKDFLFIFLDFLEKDLSSFKSLDIDGYEDR